MGILAPNAKEELGDLLWYLANLHSLAVEAGHEIGGVQDKLEAALEPPEEINYHDMVAQMAKVQTYSVQMLDTCKRLLAYGDGGAPKDAQGIFGLGLRLVTSCLRYVAMQGKSFRLAELMASNIAKLKKRYPEGFNPTDAVERKLMEEAKVIEEAGRRRAGNFSRRETLASFSRRATPGLDIEGALERQARPVANRGGTCKGGC